MPANLIVIVVGGCLALSLVAIALNLAGNRRVVRASQGARGAALAAPPPPGCAAVFVFRDQAYGRAKGTDIAVDGAAVGQLRGRTFYRLDLAAGEHVLATSVPNGRTAELRLTVHDAQPVYVRDRLKMGAVSVRSTLELTDATAGAPAVRRCDLLQPGAAPAGQR